MVNDIVFFLQKHNLIASSRLIRTLVGITNAFHKAVIVFCGTRTSVPLTKFLAIQIHGWAPFYSTGIGIGNALSEQNFTLRTQGTILHFGIVHTLTLCAFLHVCQLHLKKIRCKLVGMLRISSLTHINMEKNLLSPL